MSSIDIFKLDFEAMKQYKTNHKSFIAKYDEIEANHRGEFVAVYNNGSNIEGEKDVEILKEKVRKKVDNMDSVFIKYVSMKDYLV